LRRTEMKIRKYQRSANKPLTRRENDG